MDALQRAVDAVGGQQAELARRVSVTPQAVGQWLKAQQVPPDRCPAIERETGVRCEDLRSDLTWTRNEAGQVTGYHVRLNSAA